MKQLATPTERPVESTSRLPAWDVPHADIREEHDAYILELEMPGVCKSGIEVSVEANELTLIGHRTDPEIKGEAVYQESRRCDYRRSFEIDPSIDTNKIVAKIEQGVLKLTLPKAETLKPRKIKVGD